MKLYASPFPPLGLTLPGGRKMTDRHARLRDELPAILANAGIEPDELIYEAA